MVDHSRTDERTPVDPSPEQIRERSAAIRNRWSKRVAERRRTGARTTWLPPMIATWDVIGVLNEHQE